MPKKDIILAVVLGAVLFGAALLVKAKTGRIYSSSWNVMGTVASVSGTNRDAVRVAERAGWEIFGEFDRLLSAWNANSELSGISRESGNGKKHDISPIVANAYKTALEIASQSKGAFNPLVGNAMKLWGFNGGKAPSRKPSDEEISSLRFSIADIFFNGSQIRLEKDNMSLDLGGVAKGAAVDALAEKLETVLPGHDILIDLGGNVKSAGKKTRKIGIRNPFGKGCVAAIALFGGEAVATSGNYERFVEIDGVRYPHILDGRTGKPAANNVASVTAVAKSAALADALSTTLFVLGPEEGMKFLEKFHPDASAFWISAENEWTLSPGMESRRVE